MHLVGSKSYQRQSNVWWTPFATSTPLKTVPDNVNTENELQKQSPIYTNYVDSNRKLEACCSTNVVKKSGEVKQLMSKRTRKNKSCANFDFSSSDDESTNENKKRPIIKLSSKIQTKSVLNSKKSEKKVKVIKSTSSSKKNFSISYTKTSEPGKINISNAKISEQNYECILKTKKKKQINFQNLALDDLDSGENQVFDKAKDCRNAAIDITCLETKENSKRSFNIEENLRCMCNCNFKINKSKKDSKAKQRACTCNKNDSQTLKTLVETKFEDQLNEVNKKKCKNKLQANNSVKVTGNKKSKSKMIKPDGVVSKTKTSLGLMENKTNISHQLFSESTEQELINILDLTSELPETVENKTCLSWQKEQSLAYSSFTSPYPTNNRNCGNKSKENRFIRKSNYKKFHLPKYISNEHFSTADIEKQCKFKSFKISKKSDIVMEHQQLKKAEETGILPEAKVDSNIKKNNFEYNKRQDKEEAKPKLKSNTNKEFASSTNKYSGTNKNKNKMKLIITDANIITSNVNAVEGVNKNCKLIGSSQSVEDEKTITAERAVFRLMNELTYKEDEKGCSAVECWNVNTFKCGVFKLKVNSQMTCMTLHSNSYLGGVLIKGILKMKIGNKVLDLTPGDMAFVPPMTEWQATNIGDCESVFYYWCGRFKI